MLIVAGRPWPDRVFKQQRVQRFSVQIGEFVQEWPGLGGGGEDASHRGQRESAEADRSLEGGLYIVTPIMSDQRQESLSLEFALNLLGEQTVEELHGERAEFAEALPQE